MTTKQRIFSFCPKFEDYPLNRLLVECSVCTRFVAACCQHGPFKDPYKPGKPCHHYELVFTDGACSNNGLPNAKAGLGITMGRDDKYSWSIPVDEAIDPDLNARRTSQRAELLAAIEGLKKLHNVARNNYVVVTDSEYVVRGITEWLPSWRNRGWRTSGGKRPENLDLFLTLDEYVTSLEQDQVEVGFLHIPRAHNHIADSLAKRAAAAA